MKRLLLVVPLLAMVAALATSLSTAVAADQKVEYFENIWSRTDLPVSENMISRTWMWGPEPITPGFREYYQGAPGQNRLVQYYDKSRMEISDSRSEDDVNLWYVTNGLLVNELVTGRLQLGDSAFEQHSPAELNVAGDEDDLDGPTYASFSNVLDVLLGLPGEVITNRIDRDGNVFDDPTLAGYDVTADEYVIETNHRVASVFWGFMNSSGLVAEYSFLGLPTFYSMGTLFQNPYYATGYPITEAYWAEVKVANVYQDVLMQCFERRCLTYTPGNSDGWKVEAGNVGLHYYLWRYGEEGTPGSLEPVDVEISSIWPDEQEAFGFDDEYITITNYEPFAVELTDWWIVDEHLDVAIILPEYTLEAGDSVSIYSCDGADYAGVLYTGYCGSWWDWSDSAGLYDSEGTLVDFYWYTSQ